MDGAMVDATRPPAPSAASDAVPPEVTLGALFSGFSRVGLSGFGGVLPFARRMLVERQRWLSPQEFNSVLGLCQFLPGPNVVNLAVCVGSRYQGALGAVVAVLGMLVGPFVVVLLLGLLYSLYGELHAVQAMLRGISAVGVGLILSLGVRMLGALKEKTVYLPFVVLTFVAIAVLRLPLVLVMGVLATLSSIVAYRRIRRAMAALDAGEGA